VPSTRRTFGPGQNGGDGGGKLVWGQSCKGIRHFDCVGFISYCYWKASGRRGVAVGVEVLMAVSYRPAAILLAAK
jgi:hypothetical protein